MKLFSSSPGISVNTRRKLLFIGTWIACSLQAVEVGAQEPLEVLQGMLKKLQQEVEIKNKKIQGLARDRITENLLNWKAPNQLRTAYDYRNVTYFDLNLVTDSSLCNRIDRLFARYYPWYLRDNILEVDEDDLTDEDNSPPERVLPAAFRVYLANDGASIKPEYRRDPEIIELRILKLIEKPRWDRKYNRWVYQKAALHLHGDVRYSTGSYLKFMLSKDSSLSRELLHTNSTEDHAHHLPEQMFRVSSRGPFVVKSDSLRSVYSNWFSGFAVEPWNVMLIDSSILQYDTTKVDTQIVRVFAYSGSISNAIADTIKKDTTILKIRQTWFETTVSRAVGSKAYLDVSAFRATLGFKRWSLEVGLGNEELGYPFWSSGQLNLLVGHSNSIKFGIALPVGLGRNQEWQIVGPAKLKPRALNGIYGLIGKFDLNFGFPLAIGSAFSVGSIERGYKSLTSESGFYYIPTAIQLYFPVLFKDFESDSRNIFRMRIGYGYHRVDSGYVISRTEIEKKGGPIQEAEVGRVVSYTLKEMNSPYASFELLNLNQDYKYGFTVQYYGGSVIIAAWVELFKDVVRLEGKYLGLLREKRPWDSSPILWFSPRVRLDFGR